MPIFRSVVAKQCEQKSCPRHRQPVASSEGFCEGCEQPLVPLLAWNPRQIALAVFGPPGMMLAIYSLASYLATRPRPLTPEGRQRLESWVREADRDRVITPRERTALDALVRRERLEPRAARKEVAAIRRRLEDSRRSAERAFGLAAQGRAGEAYREYRKAVSSDPMNAMAWANLGLASAASGRDEEALGSYAKALRIDPANWLAHYNLGVLLARRGDPEQGLEHLERAFSILPDPRSRERQAMAEDLRAANLPIALRQDPRLAALVAGAGGR